MAGVRRQALRAVTALRAALLASLLAALALPAQAGWLGKSEDEITAEADAFVKGKPEALQPFLHTLYMEGEWGAVLNLDLLALAALEINRPDIAGKALDAAAPRILATHAPGGGAGRAPWMALVPRDFRGEPYERAMTFYYRGLLHLAGKDLPAARTAFAQAAAQAMLGDAEQYGPSFALATYLAGWSASCAGDSGPAQELLAGAASMAIDPYYALAPAAFPRHLTLIERGAGPQKVIAGDDATLLRFLPRPDLPAGMLRVSYARRPSEIPLRGVAANLDWMALTRDGHPLLAVVDGRAIARAPDPEGADGPAFYASLAALGTDATAVSRRLGLAAGAAALKPTGPAGTPLRHGTTAADTRTWGSLPKLVLLESYAADSGLEPTELAAPGIRGARAPLLAARVTEQCSFALLREYSALDATHGGVGNPAPWPAEPREAGREKANEELRRFLRATF